MEGTIKVLKEGYGFIVSEEVEKDTFFHANDLDGIAFDSLSVGDTLTFDTEKGDNGKTKAVNIAIV